MNFEEYRVAALRTMSKGNPAQGPGGSDFDLRQAVWGLGLAGEGSEVVELFVNPDIDSTTLMKEIGDVLWYVAAFCTHNGWSLAEVAGIDSIDMFQTLHSSLAASAGFAWGARVAATSGKVADYIKKVVGHGHTLDDAKLQDGLKATLVAIAGLCTAHGLSMEQICIANIDKLNKRYANGFSTEASLARVDVEVS